jgi:hypothetical protein
MNPVSETGCNRVLCRLLPGSAHWARWMIPKEELKLIHSKPPMKDSARVKQPKLVETVMPPQMRDTARRCVCLAVAGTAVLLEQS